MRRAELAELLALEPWQRAERSRFLLRYGVGLQLQEQLPPLAGAALARALTPDARAEARRRLTCQEEAQSC